jgi:hypothetical protein
VSLEVVLLLALLLLGLCPLVNAEPAQVVVTLGSSAAWMLVLAAGSAAAQLERTPVRLLEGRAINLIACSIAFSLRETVLDKEAR